MTVDETFLNKASYLGYRLHVGAGDFQLSLFVGPTRPQSRWPSEQMNHRTTGGARLVLQVVAMSRETERFERAAEGSPSATPH